MKAARFKGNTPVKFLDSRDYNCSLVLITDLLLEFIRKNIRFQYIITGKAKRDERWEYSMVALREGIINAIVHRDYKDPGNIQIRIFDDFLEIWSPGLLPKELAINKLVKNNRSIPRNKQILKLFHVIDEVENWGTGFARIEENCRKNGNPPPKFEERAGAFVIRIDRAVISESIKSGGASGELNGELNGELSGELNGVLSGELNEKQRLVYTEIHNNPGVNASKLSEILNIPFSTIDKYIRILIKKKLVERRGSKKTGGYYAR